MANCRKHTKWCPNVSTSDDQDYGDEGKKDDEIDADHELDEDEKSDDHDINPISLSGAEDDYDANEDTKGGGKRSILDDPFWDDWGNTPLPLHIGTPPPQHQDRQNSGRHTTSDRTAKFRNEDKGKGKEKVTNKYGLTQEEEEEALRLYAKQFKKSVYYVFDFFWYGVRSCGVYIKLSSCIL